MPDWMAEGYRLAALSLGGHFGAYGVVIVFEVESRSDDELDRLMRLLSKGATRHQMRQVSAEAQTPSNMAGSG